MEISKLSYTVTSKPWLELPLDEVAEFINGKAFKPQDWSKDGIPIIRIQNLTSDVKEFNYYNGSFDKKYLVKKGDILISWSGSLGVFEWEKDDAVLNQHIFKVVLKKNLDHRYFFHAISTKINEMKHYTHGSTMKHITKDMFLKTTIPVPPLQIQQKIGKILDKAMEIKKKHNKFLKTLDSQIMAIFTNLFGDFNNNKKNYPIKTIGEITLETKYGTSTRCDYKKSPYPILRIPNVLTGKLNFEDLKYTSSKSEFLRNKLEIGDILFVRTNGNKNYVGRCATFNATEPMGFASYLIKLKISEEVLPDFLTSFLQTELGRKEILSKVRTTAGQYNLNTENLKLIQFLCPPLNAQKKFIELKLKVDRIKENLLANELEYDNLFNSLIKNSFSGKIL